MHARTLSGIIAGGHAALIAGTWASGSPTWIVVALAALWLPVVAWTVLAWSGP